MVKRYISDKIGIDYQNWQPGDSILISAPTGSGKTTFVLNELLKYYSSKGQKILYLVNRKVLKEQLEKELQYYNPAERLCIDVQLYHEVESIASGLMYQTETTDYYNGINEGIYLVNQAIKKKRETNVSVTEFDEKNKSDNVDCLDYNSLIGTRHNPYLYETGLHAYGMRAGGLNFYNQYAVVICDECHYYFTDSNFNTKTILSYQFVRRFFRNKIKIFMSATIEEVRRKVKTDNNRFLYGETELYDLSIPVLNPYNLTNRHRVFEYSAERNYDHINVEVIGSKGQIAGLVTKSEFKWLVFVDSIEYGKKLKKDIEAINSELDNESKKTSVEFVTADYQLEPDMYSEVSGIVSNSKQNAKVLIATSVLDNGINLKDNELRNIIIIADNETEFIQMLGRRRADGLPITVYLYKYDQDHFKKRHRNGVRRYELAFQYYKSIEWVVKQMMYQFNDSYEEYVRKVNWYENMFTKSEHKRLLQKLMQGYIQFADLKTCFYELDGTFRLNLLSMLHQQELNDYYKHMIDSFEEDEEHAFYKEQLKWLKKPYTLLESAVKSSIERSRDIIVETFKKKIKENGKVNKAEGRDDEENVFTKEHFDELKYSLKAELLEVITVAKEHEDYLSYKDDINKKGRPISKPMMDFLREECGIPYSLEVKSKSKNNPTKYILNCVEGENDENKSEEQL